MGFIILITVLAWWSVLVNIVGMTPFLCDPVARRFPNHLPMFIIITTLVGLLSATFAIYVGVDDYICPLDQSGGSYGFTRNTDDMLTSAIGIIQVNQGNQEVD